MPQHRPELRRRWHHRRDVGSPIPQSRISRHLELADTRALVSWLLALHARRGRAQIIQPHTDRAVQDRGRAASLSYFRSSLHRGSVVKGWPSVFQPRGYAAIHAINAQNTRDSSWACHTDSCVQAMLTIFQAICSSSLAPVGAVAHGKKFVGVMRTAAAGVADRRDGPIAAIRARADRRGLRRFVAEARHHPRRCGARLLLAPCPR
jgi:hypothetical protein